MVIIEFVMMVLLSVRDGHHLGVEIDALHITVEDLDSLEQFADRTDDMCNIQIAGRNLVEHRCEEKEILAVDERDLDVFVARKCLVEVQGRIQPAEAAAEYKDFGFLVHRSD